MLRRGRVSLAAALSATLNFTNSILGAGLMGIPYALRQAGMLPGIVLLVAVGLVSDWSVGLMVKSGKRVGARSYQELMGRTFGPAGSHLCALFQVTFAIGCLCIYQMIISENLGRLFSALMPGSGLAHRSFLTLAGALFGLLPLSLAKDLGVLGRAALLSVGGNVLITLCVLWEARTNNMQMPMGAEGSFRWFAPNFIQAIGVIAFSFVCHHNSFLIQGSLGTRSLALFSAVTSTSIAFSLLLSLLLAVPSYWAFGGRTDPNILNNFSLDGPLISGCRLVFAVSLYLTYPLDCFVARDVLVRTCFPRANYKKPRLTHYAVTLVIVAFTTAITLTFEDLGAVLELTGGVTASALAFIFPAACYLKLAEKGDRCLQAGAYGLLYFGCLVMILAAAGPLFRSSAEMQI
jgi:sodium-coupled neutral amino acid transporter 11